MHEEKIPAVFWATNESFFAPCDFLVTLTGFFIFYKEPCCYPSCNAIFSSYIWESTPVILSSVFWVFLIKTVQYTYMYIFECLYTYLFCAQKQSLSLPFGVFQQRQSDWAFLVLSVILIHNIPVLAGSYKIKCTAVTQLLTHQWMTGRRA